MTDALLKLGILVCSVVLVSVITLAIIDRLNDR